MSLREHRLGHIENSCLCQTFSPIYKSKGDIIVTFPSDNEYAPEDIKKIVTRLYSKDALVVYGSRMIKYKQKKYLKKIYKNNYLLYLTSKGGGLLIRLLILISLIMFTQELNF